MAKYEIKISIMSYTTTVEAKSKKQAIDMSEEQFTNQEEREIEVIKINQDGSKSWLN